jgi:phospholipase/lecithinase/hemolysin
VGNIDEVTPAFFSYPGPYYYNGRFSNGPVYVEALATGLGLPPIVHSQAGGKNFAYGGAKTFGTDGLEGIYIRDIDEQVTEFLDTPAADPDALFVVFAGSNDLVDGQTNMSIPVNNLAADIGRLIADGARNFLVPNLPPLGHTARRTCLPRSIRERNNSTLRSARCSTAWKRAILHYRSTASTWPRCSARHWPIRARSAW